MTIREYKRICKQAGCGQEFIVSAPSIEEDRAIGFSEPEYCPKHRALHARSYSRIACHHYEVEMTEAGEALVRQIEQDKLESQREERVLKGKQFDPWAMPGEGFGPGGLGRFQRPLRAFIASAEHEPQPKVFQIAEKREELLAALEDHQVVVLVGTTGSGKSTYVPWLLLTGGEPGQLSKWARRGPICVTQPRIQATRQVPRFIAHALNGTSLGVGSQIGFSHSNAEEFDRRTRLIFKTDGKLLNDIVSGAVSNYSIIIIDEAHERSVNIDLILGLLKDQLYLYPHLRVIVASATIDFEAFLGFFHPHLKDTLQGFQAASLIEYNYFKAGRRVPFIYSEGRRYKITEHWWGAAELLGEFLPGVREELIPDWWKRVNGGQLPTRDQLPQCITELVQQLCEYLDALPQERKEKEEGHILVFLPGSREIDQTVSEINAVGLSNVVSLPLYAQRPLEEQEAALNPSPERHPGVYGKRRVVVSTNVAETSLTVEGVKYVIDSGYIKQSYWNPVTEVSELQTTRHSQAGCRQRWGRAGRTSLGHAYMLYTHKQFDETFPTESTPEIARASLEQVLLTAKSAGVRTAGGKQASKVLDFGWMPLAKSEDRKRFQQELSRANESLKGQGAIDGDGDLTRFGLELRGIPAAMDVARIFTEGERHAMGVEVATLLPFLKLEYGLQVVLRWEREWDPYTKLAIRRSHLELVYGCRDDLELYLKLWVLWENYSDEERRRWETEGGIHYQNFQERIEAERRKILETAMDWRKAEKRSVSIKKIDALRALIAYCLRREMYVPIELAIQHEPTTPRSRLTASLPLMWDASLEAGEYEEYDEELFFDATFAAETSGRSGVYCRYHRQPGESDEASLIELAPTSICFGQADTTLLVACQRRANFRRPARAKVLGMNMIRVEREWLDALQGSVVARAALYAALSRRGDPATQQRLQERLFLPWIVPRGRKVRGTVQSGKLGQGARLELRGILPGNFALTALRGKPYSLMGWLPLTELQDELAPGTELLVEVVDYGQDEVGQPRLLLKELSAPSRAFKHFAKQHRNGEVLDVEMCQILEDPLGYSPMFIVRDPLSGLEIPMADTNFCGNTHPQSYFGRRFALGESFKVEIEAIDHQSEEVYLSRGRQLLREYEQVRVTNLHLVKVTVRRVDKLGAYLAIPGSEYVGFVRRALWPMGVSLSPGDEVEARLRRFNRQINVAKLEERLKEGKALPEELDLGIDLDLRIAPAYDRFCQQGHQPGSLISVMVEKVLDSGGVLVALDEVLKGMLYESELALDDMGRLKSARDYAPGETITVLLYQMVRESVTLRCSAFRVLPLPPTLDRGQILEVRVLLVQEDSRDENRLWLTCSLDNRYLVQIQASLTPDGPFEEGEIIQVQASRVDRLVNVIRATYMGRPHA